MVSTFAVCFVSFATATSLALLFASGAQFQGREASNAKLAEIEKQWGGSIMTMHTTRRTLRTTLRALLLATACIAGVAAPAMARAKTPPLELKVVTSSEASLYADFTLIMGAKDAILVDVPFTRADGLRLAADILETGKTLKTIYITHDHPDHFFSVDVFTDLFPGVEVVSAPQVVDDIWKSYPLKLKRWGPGLGINGPRHPVAVTAVQGNSLTLDGQKIEILGPMQGDHIHATAIYIPSIDALICGDLCFNKIHLWFGEQTAAQYDDWLASIDKMIALHPKIVVPGHKIPGLPNDPSALDFTRRYIVAFKAAAAKSKTSKELIATIQSEFPDTQDVLNNFILGTSAQVATHEIPPWQE
jgi:glyoxylase-like metal-dependent hydrolase (beta-lactamase superfamily II)